MGKNKGSSKSQKRAESGKEAHTSAEHDGRKKRHRPKWFKRFLEAFACSRKQSNEVDNDAYVMSAPKKVEINDISSTRDSSYDNIPSSTKTEATITLTKTAEIHESPTRESQEVKSTNVPNQKKTQKRIDVEPKAPVIIKERAEECERNNCENVSSVKSRETEMGNYQRTTHASALIASTAQPLGLCEVDSASNTRRIPTEKSAEVKSLQVPVDPPVQRMRVHTQDDQLSSLTSQQQSSHQESVPKLKDKVPYNVQPENNPTSLSLSKVEEDRGGRQQELVPSVSNCDPVPGILTMNEELTENKSCLVKVVDYANKTDEKTSVDNESLHDTTTDNIEERSVENLSHPKPSVNLSTDQISVGLSHEADSFVKDNSAPVILSNTVCDSTAAAHIESAIEEEEDKKTVADILLVDTGYSCCTLEQQPEINVRPTMNLKSILVNDQDKDESSIEEEDMKTVDNTLLLDTGYSCCTLEQEPKIIVRPTLNLKLIKVNDQDEDGFADDTQMECEIDENIFTDTRDVDEEARNDLILENSHAVQNIFETQSDEEFMEPVAEPKDIISKVDETIGDWSVDNEENAWKEASFEETFYWNTVDFGDDVETKIDDAVEDKQIDWEEILYDDICDWKNAGETAIDEDVEDEENDWKKILPIEDWRTADYGEADKTNYWMSEDKQNELEAAMDDKTEFGRTEIPSSYNSSDVNSLETNSTEESVEGLLANIHSGRPAESIFIPPIGNELDLNTVERDDSHRDEEEQGNALVQRRERETERQDIANVQQNTETKRVNDHGERGVSSPVASTLQTPVEKVPAVTATEREIQSTKINKGKDTSKENAKNMRPVGLQNLGNTCFFNAVMQNLNQSFLLYEVLDKEGCRLSLTKSMLGFYKQMSSGTSYTVNPYQVLSDICKRSPRFAGGRQQDSHELLRHLLDGLRNEERESSVDPNNRKVLTRVDKVFGGHFMTVYTCSDCKMPYHVCEPLLDISLPISNEAFQTDEESSVDEEDGEVSLEDETGGDHVTYMYQKAAKSMMTPLAIGQKQEAQDDRIESISEAEVPQDAKKKKNRNKRKSRGKPNGQQSATKKCRTEGRSILDCLDVFTRTEHIADEYLCMACHAERVNQGATDYQMTSAKKRTLIYNPPALLTLHLKRFRQTDYGFTKCDDTISYPDMIDIAPYCSSWCLRNEGHETSIWYSLYGLVVHGGSLDGGHYVAYIKLRETEENIRQFLQQSYLDRDQLTKEELVRTLKQMHVLPTKPDQKEKWQPQPLKGRWFYISDSHCSEVSEDEVWRQQAYLLFYERRQGNAVPPNKSVLYQRFEGTSV